MSITDKVVFKANGKLLLTGEYLVLNGATALALPLSFGQSLTAQPVQGDVLTWTSIDSNGVWFEGDFAIKSFDLLNSTNLTIGNKLANILKQALALNPDHQIVTGYKIETFLNFNRQWGFGSSSTLIAIVAWLFGVDKYKLFSRVSSGSGYDIACTEIDHPILYTRVSPEEAIVKPVSFNPSFLTSLWFVYLGNKQSTDIEVDRYNKITKKDLSSSILSITDITLKVMQVDDLITFAKLMDEHEHLMSEILERETIKKSRFAEFNGSIKSLGAWGGDFVLACSERGESYIHSYFKEKGISTIYNFSTLVLRNQIINQHDTIIRF